MEDTPKFDIKSVIKLDISIKPTTWIGHKIVHSMRNATLIYLNLTIQGKQTRKILRKHTAQ